LLRTTHTAVAVYFGFSAWQLQVPRRCFVVVNAAALSMWGMAMLALGISQCVGAAQSGDPTAALLVGIELMILGLAVAIGGGYGGWVYHKRRLAEILVVVDVFGQRSSEAYQWKVLFCTDYTVNVRMGELAELLRRRGPWLVVLSLPASTAHAVPAPRRAMLPSEAPMAMLV
jgi:hypothetical protein